MRKTNAVLELEARYGKPLERIIVETYDRHGSIRLAADELGVKPNTFYSWMRYFGIAIGGKRAVPRDRETISA